MTTTVRPEIATRATTSPRADLALLVGLPLLWAAILLFHPTGDPAGAFELVHDDLTAWQLVHLSMAACIPLFAYAVHRMLRGIDTTPARISRWALPVFAVTYGIFEAIMGIGTGILVGSSDALDTAARSDAVQSYIESSTLANIEHVASASCGIALVAAAFALRRAQRIQVGHLVALLLATPLIAIHAPPFGPVGLVLFAAVAHASLRTR